MEAQAHCRRSALGQCSWQIEVLVMGIRRQVGVLFDEFEIERFFVDDVWI